MENDKKYYQSNEEIIDFSVGERIKDCSSKDSSRQSNKTNSNTKLPNTSIFKEIINETNTNEEAIKNQNKIIENAIDISKIKQKLSFDQHRHYIRRDKYEKLNPVFIDKINKCTGLVVHNDGYKRLEFSLIEI